MRLPTPRVLSLVFGFSLLPVAGEILRGERSEQPACADAHAGISAFDPTAASCGTCHTEIHREWSERGHSHAWTDEVYQADLKKKTRTKQCLPCHIPQSVLDRMPKKPRTRDVHKDEGVTCVSCHEQDGVIHGPFGAETEAHPSAKHEAFTTKGSTALCASCHSTSIADVLGVAKDHAKVYPDQVSKTCVECHMPEVERVMAVDPESGEATGPARKGRSHRVLGPFDVEFCATAFGLSAAVQDGQVVLTIENKAGHRVPGLKLRTFAIHATVLGADDGELAQHEAALTGREPLDVDPPTRAFQWPGVDGAQSLRVRIVHLFLDEEVATVVDTTLPLR